MRILAALLLCSLVPAYSQTHSLVSKSDIAVTMFGVVEPPPALQALTVNFQPYTLVFAESDAHGTYVFTLLYSKDGKPETSSLTAKSYQYNPSSRHSAAVLFPVDPRAVTGVSVAPLLPIPWSQ